MRPLRYHYGVPYEISTAKELRAYPYVSNML